MLVLSPRIRFYTGIVCIITVMEFTQIIFKFQAGCIRKLDPYKETMLK